MKSRFWVYSGDRPSNGARELASCEGFLRLRDGRFHKVKKTDFIINWGSTVWPNPLQWPMGVLNTTVAIGRAANKLLTFQNFYEHEISCVSWTTDEYLALSWCLDGSTVVIRNKLTGHSGDGIFIIDKGKVATLADLQNFGKPPLYTKYVFKEKEFRVNVVSGQVIDTQQKIKDPEREVLTWKVRSHANGFMFVRNGIEPDAARDALAISATSALGLDFGAVDIIQDKKGNYLVLEINTAPGLEGQTIDSYAKAFRKYADGN